MRSADNLVNWLVLAVLGVAWGLTIPLTKIAVSTGHHPVGLIFWQFIIAVLALGAFVMFRRLKVKLQRNYLVFCLVICLIGTLIPNSFSYFAASHLPAGIMGIIIASVPIFSLTIGYSFRIEALSLKRVVGVALGMAAVILIGIPDASLPDPEKAVFVLVALIAPFCYGCESNYLMVRSPGTADPVVTLFTASVIGVAIAGPLAYFGGAWVSLSTPWEAPEYAMFVSALLHAIAYSGYIWLVSRAGAVFASQIAYIVTIAAVFLSALILQEAYSNWVWLALALMVGGISLVQPKAQSSENQI